MSLLYAWRNLCHNRRRSAAALAGLTGAVLLVFFHLGLLVAVRRTTTRLYDCFACDIVIVSAHYEYAANLGHFDRVRLMQAAVVPGVAEALPVGVAEVDVVEPRTKAHAAIQLVGMPLRAEFVADPSLRSQLEGLAGGSSLLLDTAALKSEFADQDVRYLDFRRERVRVAGRYRLGAGLQFEGGAFVELEAWPRLAGRPGREVELGLVRTVPGADTDRVVRTLRAALPRDVLVATREDFVRNERDYFTREKPIGVVFYLGALVGAVAAAALLYQVLAADIAVRLPEYATLKAMGFRTRFVYRIGLWQAALLLALATGGAAAMTTVIFAVLRHVTAVPAGLDGSITSSVVVLVGVLGSAGTALALVRLRRAAPADLFG